MAYMVYGCTLVDCLAVLTSLLVIGYTYVSWCYSYWKRRNVPYVAPSFPFGNIPNPFFGKSSDNFGDKVKEFYDYAKSEGYRHLGIYFMLSKTYLVMDVEMVKNVMAKDFNHFVDRGFFTNEKADPIGAHLFAVGGKKWKNLRTKMTPTFTSGKMRAMFQTLVDCGLILEKYVEEYAKSKEAVDIKNVLGCFSTDIIGSCAFGLECNSFKEPDSPFRKYGQKIFQPESKLKSIYRMIIMQSHTLARTLGVRQVDKDISDFFTKVVTDTVEYREKNNLQRNDFLQLLINARDKNEEDRSNGDNTLLTMNEIIAQSFVFFVAGFETSATTMTFALFELSRNPEIQDRVRKEIEVVLSKHDNQITYDSLNELKYMSQVIDETLRLYAPLSFITRKCVEDYKVPGEDVIIEKGTRVLIPVRGIHYDKDFYPDPEKFDPERFTEENKRSRHQYAHIPFGEGPRICIGQRFGIMETKVGLTCILRKFRVSLSERTEVPLKMNPRSFITSTVGGIWLNLEKL